MYAMKRKLWIAIVMAPIFLLWGCVKEVEQPNDTDESLREVVFHAGWDAETKTVLQEDGRIFWEPGDEIGLYAGGNGPYKFTSTNSEVAAKADFIGMMPDTEGPFYAIYPYDNAISGNEFTIPSVQYAIAGGFTHGQIISFARSDNNSMTFYNTFAGIKFSLANEGISKVVIKNREDYEPIVGKMSIQFPDNFPEDSGVIPQQTEVSNVLTIYPSEGEYFIPGEYYYASVRPCTSSFVFSFYTDTKVATTCLYDRWLTRSRVAVIKELDKDLDFIESENNVYAVLGGRNILPDGVDKTLIENVEFHTNSSIETGTIVPASIPHYTQIGYYDLDYIPVYFELSGTTAHYYTTADKYLMGGPSCISFAGWTELKSVDLSMFCTNQVMDFDAMFDGCINLETVDLSSFDTSHGRRFDAMFQNCTKLKSLDISNFSSKNAIFGFDCMFNKLFNLTSLDLGNFEVNGDVDGCMFGFARNSHNCAIRCTPETKDALRSSFSGLGAYEDYVTWVLPSEDLPTLEPFEFDYYSTDYSKDKTYKLFNMATVGNGVNIVLMGDGYSDRMIADGTYDKDMTKAMNAIFKDEPYASFKDYFNVYEVYAVSENESAGESNTAFNSFLGGMDPVNGTVSYLEEYYLKKYARIPDNNIDETCVILILNQSAGEIAGVAHNGYIIEGDDVNTVSDYAKGGSYVMVCGKVDDDSFSSVVAHEFGHGFAKLGDEYAVYGGFMQAGEREEYLRLANNYGWWSNLDFIDDPATIKWNHFLNDSRYEGTGIGVYEGATYEYGVWRPSQHSIMNENTGMFNAPSREIIYKRIHTLAFGKDWVYDYETFVEWDQKNIEAEKTANIAPANHVPYPARANKKHLFKMEESTTPDGKKMVTVIMD